MRSHPILSLLIVPCLLAFMYSARADDEIDSGEAARLQQSGELLRPEEILERARSSQPGEVTEIELKQKQGQYAYEVDVVDGNGVKRELTFDAKTGAVLAIEEDDDSEDDDSEGDDECEEKG